MYACPVPKLLYFSEVSNILVVFGTNWFLLGFLFCSWLDFWLAHFEGMFTLWTATLGPQICLLEECSWVSENLITKGSLLWADGYIQTTQAIQTPSHTLCTLKKSLEQQRQKWSYPQKCTARFEGSPPPETKKHCEHSCTAQTQCCLYSCMGSCFIDKMA